MHIVGQAGVRAERGEVHAVGFVGRVVLHLFKRLGFHAHEAVDFFIFGIEGVGGGLVQKEQVAAFHIEADDGDGAVAHLLEDGVHEKLDGAGFGSQPAGACNIQVSCFGTDQEVGVEIDGGFETAVIVDSDRHAPLFGDFVDAQGNQHIRFGCQIDRADGHGLDGLFGFTAQHGGGVDADFGAVGGRLRVGFAVRTEKIEHRADHIVIGVPFGHDSPHGASRRFHHDQCADTDRAIGCCPEVELERGAGLAFGCDHTPHQLTPSRRLPGETILNQGLRLHKPSPGNKILPLTLGFPAIKIPYVGVKLGCMAQQIWHTP
ncbi:hypothetical protein HRbin14_01945 [bacterium HR14]|nr:hypothetical protein HRbin14_01945 [bacterium HR14]